MALALDGSVSILGTSGANIAFPSFTTANANDIICAFVLPNGTNVTSITGASLTFTKRSGSVGGNPSIELWTAVAASALSGVTITTNLATGAGFFSGALFGISGADTSTTFDANASVPAVGTTGTLSVSTNTADTFIIGSYRMGSTGSPTNGAGFTQIAAGGGGGFFFAEYKIVSATQSGLSIAIGTGAGDQNGGLADAVIIAAGGGPAFIARQPYQIRQAVNRASTY